MKKFIIGSTLGVVLGAGAFAGISQIPAVNNALVINKEDAKLNLNDTKVEELEKEKTTLEKNIDELNSKILEYNELIKSRDIEISSKTETINSLTEEKNQLLTINDKLQNVDIPTLTNEKIMLEEEYADLKAELDTYKELVGSDLNYLEMINSLTTELETVNSQLTVATAELDQLRVEKETLTAKVNEYEIKIQALEEELSQWKSLEDIDKLNVENFNGVWYLNGTFEEWYTIENGIVTYGANEDKGTIYNMYNQMYMTLNTSGGQKINLSDDGLSITMEDGSVFTKFYTNIDTPILVDNALMSGTYKLNDIQISINYDNTLSYSIGDKIYYGSYVANGTERNIGGNIQLNYLINATIHMDNDEKLIKTFKYVNTYHNLLDVDTNEIYSPYTNNLVMVGSVPDSCNYYLTKIKLRNHVRINSSSNVEIFYSATINSGSNYNVTRTAFGGKSLGSSSSGSVNLNSSNVDYILTDYICFSIHSNSSGYDRIKSIDKISKIKIDGVSIDFKIIDMDCVDIGYSGIIASASSLYDKYNLYEEISSSYISCLTIQDYINGTYENEDIQYVISSDGVIVNISDTEPIIASYITSTAKTDGYDIYHTVTIKYVTTTTVDETTTETTNTLVVELKNDDYVSSTLNSNDIVLTKK